MEKIDAMEIREVEVEASMELGQAVAYLEEIVAGLKSGRLCLENEGEELLLSPQRQVKVLVEARHKKDKESVGIKLTWHVPMPQKAPIPALRISSKSGTDGH